MHRHRFPVQAFMLQENIVKVACFVQACIAALTDSAGGGASSDQPAGMMCNFFCAHPRGTVGNARAS